MPPKPALTSSFLVSTDAENEVVCPLTNQDGSQCRKRCIGVRPPPAIQSTPTTLHCALVSINDTTADLNSTGETVPVYARTYSTRTPRLLHPKVAGDRGKFPINDHDSTLTTTTTAAYHCDSPYEEMYVMCATVESSGLGLRSRSRCQ